MRRVSIASVSGLLAVLVLGSLLRSPLAAAAGGSAARARSHRGWGYLIDKLGADGLPRERVLKVFRDPRFGTFTELEFSLSPRESPRSYRSLLGPTGVTRARRCAADHAVALRAAEREHGVPASVVAAILYIESGCGRNTGSHRILPRLARLAMANEPGNLRRNIERHRKDHPPARREEAEPLTRARGRALEEMFYPEVRATFVLADRLGIDPLAIRGSRSGAFGLPQFLPSSYLKHAVDGDGNGAISLHDPEDAIASCANYLAAHGWRPGLSLAQRREVLWSYNHSAAYIDAVLALAKRLGH